MPNRVLFLVIVLVGAPAVARADEDGRAPLALADNSAGAGTLTGKLATPAGTAPVAAPPVKASPTFVELHSARVENDLLLFQPVLRASASATVRAPTADLVASAPPRPQPRFFTPARIADDLELRRERDRQLLLREPQPRGGALGLGLAMFGATTVLSAHAPRPLRVVFDGPVHLGPAVFDGGGMGAGIAGRGF